MKAPTTGILEPIVSTERLLQRWQYAHAIPRIMGIVKDDWLTPFSHALSPHEAALVAEEVEVVSARGSTTRLGILIFIVVSIVP